MEVDDFFESLEALDRKISNRSARRVNTNEERNAIRAVAGTWFRSYRPLFVRLFSSEAPLEVIDGSLQDLLNLATGKGQRSAYRTALRRAMRDFRNNLLTPLTRAYWEGAGETASPDFSEIVARRLEQMDPSLRDSYETVISDLNWDDRKSFKGTANELREVLREVLHRLAPTEEVQNEHWFEDAHQGQQQVPAPTHAERAKYILFQKRKGSAGIESVEQFVDAAADRLGAVVRSSYTRANAAAHAQQAKAEIQAQLRYINALLLELLPE